MGIIHSIVCSLSFCLERVLTWACCGFLLVLLMFTIVTFMIYGIAVGYHYAEKEIKLRGGYYPWWRSDFRRSNDDGRSGSILEGEVSQPGLRVDMGEGELTASLAEEQPTPSVQVEADSTLPPYVFEEKRIVEEAELSDQEKELTRRLVGRFRRSQNISEPFLRPLRPLNLTISSVQPLT